MLSLLTPASAPAAATAQAPGFATRSDNAADGGTEFAKALEQSSSSWHNQAPAESTARPTPPAQRSQALDGSPVPAAQDTAPRARPKAANAKAGDQERAGTAHTSTTASAEEAAGEGAHTGRAGMRRMATDMRQAGAAQRQRSQSAGTRRGTESGEAGDSRTADPGETQPAALDEDISLAAGLTPPPQASPAEPPQPVAPAMPTSAPWPPANGQAAVVPGDASAAAEQDAAALPAIDAAAQRGLAGGIATTALASSYRGQTPAGNSSAAMSTRDPAASSPSAPAASNSTTWPAPELAPAPQTTPATADAQEAALAGKSPPGASGAADAATTAAAEATLPATRTLPAGAAARPDSPARQGLTAVADNKPAGAAAAPGIASTRGNGSDRLASQASDSGGDKRSAAPDSRRTADSRPSRDDNEASALARSVIASPGTRSQGEDSSGKHADSPRDNSVGVLANPTAATSSGAASSARLADQLQGLLPASPVAAAAPQPMSSPAATPVLTAQLSPSLYSPEFAPAMGAQVTLFAREGVHHARIELNPAEMGPISVQIELKGSGARVDFQAEQAGTRQVIESSLPALASALRDAGMTLTGGGVFQPDVSQAASQNGTAFGNPAGGNQGALDNGQAQGSGGQRGDSQGGRGGRGAADDGSLPAGTTSTVRLAAGQRGLVDLVA